MAGADNPTKAVGGGTKTTTRTSISNINLTNINLTNMQSGMELFDPVGPESFVIRLALRRTVPLMYPGAPMPRHLLPLVDGEVLDELLCAAFDCDDTDGTFRGHLRQAVDGVKEHVLTSLCAWRMGEGLDTSSEAELTLLATVLPGSISRAEAIAMIEALRKVLER